MVLNFSNPNLFSPAVQLAGRPILESKNGFFVNLGDWFSFLIPKEILTRENRTLKDKLALLEAAETERDFYKLENAKLSKLSEKLATSSDFAVVSILSKPGFSAYDTIIIDGGSRQGIAVGDNILADQDVILGVVSEVYTQTSLVTLFSSFQYETPIFIGEFSVESLATGRGGGNFEVKLPKNTEIKVGDIVIIASTSPKILGSIMFIHESPTDTFERALFKSSVDIAKLRFVLVEKK